MKTNKYLDIFLGTTLLTQAITSLIGGSIFLGPFDNHTMNDLTLREIAANVSTGYTSILLQIITALVIILLAIAMFRIAGHVNLTLAYIGLLMYVFEALLLVMDQVLVFGLLEVARSYAETMNSGLFDLAANLYACSEFAGKMAMIPFGIGAIAFYYLISRAQVVPKWLGWYGMLTVILIMIGVPMMAFGIEVPYGLLVPYVPFEFFTGLYIIVKNIKQ